MNRHCEPTGRANARPMTGSAKQSICRTDRMDCSGAHAPRNDDQVGDRTWNHLGPAANRDLPDGLIFRIHVKLAPQKYFSFSEPQISRMVHLVPRSMRGRIAVVTRRGAGRDGRGRHQPTSDACHGRRRRVVLISRRWDQAREPSHGRRWLSKPGHRGERAISRKPLCRECRMFRRTCSPTSRAFCCTRDCGCVERPAFPAPSVF